jgi:hypothetical protein
MSNKQTQRNIWKIISNFSLMVEKIGAKQEK